MLSCKSFCLRFTYQEIQSQLSQYYLRYFQKNAMGSHQIYLKYIPAIALQKVSSLIRLFKTEKLNGVFLLPYNLPCAPLFAHWGTP